MRYFPASTYAEVEKDYPVFYMVVVFYQLHLKDLELLYDAFQWVSRYISKVFLKEEACDKNGHICEREKSTFPSF